MFQLVFKGECTPGTDPEKAREGAKALFKANQDQIARMFSGQPVVIRNKLEEVQAEKYRAVLEKHGMVAYVEPMPGAAPATGKPESPAEPQSSKEPQTPRGPQPPEERQPTAKPQTSEKPEPERSSASARAPGESVAVEPGDRLPVAGEKVDTILSGSGLTLDPVGVTIQEHHEQQAPMFEHLDDWTLAPAGSELGEKKDAPPPMVPDVSHLSLDDRD